MERFNIKINRRSFLKGAAALAAVPLWYAEETFALPQAEAPKSANDNPALALIGCGGRVGEIATWHLTLAMLLPFVM